MIYFLKIYFQNELEKQQTEIALRKFAIKKHTSLDIQSATNNAGANNSFLGLEGTKDIKFTRIRTSFERVLPKLIISLPKDNLLFYKIRLSIFSTLVFFALSFGLILNITFLILGKTTIYNLITIGFFYTFYILLFFIELHLTKSRIKNAIKVTSTITAEKHGGLKNAYR